MSWAQDIEASVSAWRRYSEGLEMLRKAAKQGPAAAALDFDVAARELQDKALMDLYYFGVLSPQARYTRRLEDIESPEAEAEKEALFFATHDHDHAKYVELAAQGFFDLPKEKEELLRKGPMLNFDEEVGSTLAAMQYMVYKTARHEMSVAGEASRTAGQGYYGPAVCEAFLEISSQGPVIFAGGVQKKWGGDPRTRSMAASALVGWVASRISLRYPRLRTALGDVKQSSPYEQLIEGLPGAVVIEWAALEREEPLAVLVSRTTHRLEKEGNQTSSLGFKGKLAAEGLDKGIGEGEPDLEEFAMREDLRTLEEAAKLTEQQRRILELTLDNQPDRTIAERLGLTVDAVKSSKKLARENMRRAAGQ
jgi:hypothetical protein